ncbi:MAG: hypothetical protein KGL35_00895 [Bradyrhizobium sp.]|nr:hypothetical protein [Bradyrhizobium sp.]
MDDTKSLLTGVKTSLLHLMASAPIDLVNGLCGAYKCVCRALDALPNPGTEQPNSGIPSRHPMAAEALRYADELPQGIERGRPYVFGMEHAP